MTSPLKFRCPVSLSPTAKLSESGRGFIRLVRGAGKSASHQLRSATQPEQLETRSAFVLGECPLPISS